MDTVQTLFKKIETRPAGGDLEDVIVRAVFAARNRELQRRLAVTYFGLFLSGAAVISASILYGGMFVGSEFWSIIALLFSDVTVIASYWNEFFLLLLETVPVMATLSMLVPTFIFLLFLNRYLQTPQARHYSHQ